MSTGPAAPGILVLGDPNYGLEALRALAQNLPWNESHHRSTLTTVVVWHTTHSYVRSTHATGM